MYNYNTLLHPALLTDSVVHGKRIIIYCTDSCLDLLQHPRVAISLVDGMFYTATVLFEQTWIVRVILDGFAFSVAYAFLENKTTQS